MQLDDVMVEWGDTIIKLAASWYLPYPVVDKTLFEGGRNFTLNWNSGDHVPGRAAAARCGKRNCLQSEWSGVVL